LPNANIPTHNAQRTTHKKAKQKNKKQGAGRGARIGIGWLTG
jgi:hypothetical protein